jgi:hypothetical protein
MHGSDYSEQCTVSKFDFFTDLSFLLPVKYPSYHVRTGHTTTLSLPRDGTELLGIAPIQESLAANIYQHLWYLRRREV